MSQFFAAYVSSDDPLDPEILAHGDDETTLKRFVEDVVTADVEGREHLAWEHCGWGWMFTGHGWAGSGWLVGKVRRQDQFESLAGSGLLSRSDGNIEIEERQHRRDSPDE